jgi:hypothetical protein
MTDLSPITFEYRLACSPVHAFWPDMLDRFRRARPGSLVAAVAAGTAQHDVVVPERVAV